MSGRYLKILREATMLKWNQTEEESDLVSLIVKRAKTEFAIFRGYESIQIEMDITATHCNGCRLDLGKLLKSSGTDFLHDVHGIIHNLDRKTGRLKNQFLPRCIKK